RANGRPMGADMNQRVDIMGRNRATGQIEIFETKAGPGALSDHQAITYPQIGRYGGTVKGANGRPFYKAGTPIDPTQARIIRPSQQSGPYWPLVAPLLPTRDYQQT